MKLGNEPPFHELYDFRNRKEVKRAAPLDVALPIVVDENIRGIEWWFDIDFDYVFVTNDELFCVIAANFMKLDGDLVREDLWLEPSKGNIEFNLKLVYILPGNKLLPAQVHTFDHSVVVNSEKEFASKRV